MSSSKARKSTWLVIGGSVRKVLRLLFTFYYLITVSFRLGFRSHVEFKSEYLHSIVMDYFVDIFFWSIMLYKYYVKVSGHDKKVAPRGRGMSRLLSGVSTLELSKMTSRRDMSGIINTHPSSTSNITTKLQVVPENSPTESSAISPTSSTSNPTGALQSFSDHDIFGDTSASCSGNDADRGTGSFSESDLLSNFRNNEENHEMLISIKKTAKEEGAHYLYDVLNFLMLCPFELFGFLLGYEQYYLLRYFRIIRLCYIPSYFREITRILVDSEMVVGASARRVLYLTTFMIFFAHVGACCFYALGLYLVEHGTTDVWMTADGILSFRDDGTYFFNKPLEYRYVRVLYWAVVTSQTVGFGDVSPRAIEETSFCLVFFYCSHFLCAQLAIGNLLLLFDVYDSARTQYKERIEQLEKYSQFRKLPADLKDRMTYFYYHQWKVLKGLDESQLLEELPNNIKIKVKQATIRKHLLRVPMLKRLKMVVMNALADDVKLIIFSPSDVIVPMDSMSTGMYIISRGEAFISSKSNNTAAFGSTATKEDGSDAVLSDQGGQGSEVRRFSEEYDNKEVEVWQGEDKGGAKSSKVAAAPSLTQSLKQGDFFGSRGLSHKYEHSLSLNAGTVVCEVLFLSRVRFQRTISLLLSDEEAMPYLEQRESQAESSSEKLQSREKRLRGFHPTLSYVRASSVLNMETTTISAFMLRLKSDGDIRAIWDLVVLFGIVVYSITIPFNLSHTFSNDLLHHDFVFFVIEYLVDLFMLLDFLARMFVFPSYSKSILMTSPMHIFSSYRERYPFFLELLSVLPFDIISMISRGGNLLPFLRLLKIYHLSKFEDYGSGAEKALTKYFNISLSFSTSRFIRLQIGLFELCHWAACTWQLVAEFSTHQLTYDINWKIQDSEADYLSIDYSSNMDGFTSYIRSLYWAINALSTSGVADMPSTNVAEMLFVCFALLLGCQSINALLGSIASMMGNINKNKSDFSNKMDTVCKYMTFKRLPVRLQLKIQFFFEYNFQRTHGVDEMRLLAGLPQPLREDVVSFVVGSVVMGIPFFKHCNEPMLEMILGLLTRRCFLNNDDVVLAGEFGQEFFIIESGMILVTSKDKQTVYANLQHGSYIGESCLLKVVERTASAHARDYSETYVLKKRDFENVVEMFPEDGEIVKVKINELLASRKELNSLTEKRKTRRSMISTFVRMESIHSLDTSDLTLWNTFLEEFSYVHKLWQCLLLFVLMYNLFMIPLRLAFTKDSFALYYVVDYYFDVILWVDMYLNAYKFRRIIGGKKIKFQHHIWANYKKSQLKLDLLARAPYDLIALAFIGDTTALSPWFVLAFLRLPKMFLLFRGTDFLAAAEDVLERANISFFALRMLQVLVSCLMVGHCLGCGLYVLQKEHYGESCVNEEGAFYGEACKFRDTWVQFLIYTGKLPADGGSAFARYVAGINWAIPTMVLYTVGDVYPMNVSETTYIFAAMFVGIPINAMIVGTIIALVTQVDDQSADILMKSDTLRESLLENNAEPELIAKVSGYIKFLVSEEGKLLGKEEEIYEELPHTLQVSLSSHLKAKFLHACPFFDHTPDEAVRNLCMTMKQSIFYIGDYVVRHGDIGHEMFFIESGECQVISWDRRTVLANLNAGAFLGETSFFGLSDHNDVHMNLENVRATSICVCYVLNKRHYVHEMAPFTDGIGAEMREQNLSSLRNTHCKRNADLLRNLKMMDNARSKLNRTLGPANVTGKSNFWNDFFSSEGLVVSVVDIVGYLCMLYYAFAIPFEISFLHGDIEDYHSILMFDFFIDMLCGIELLLRLTAFSSVENNDAKSYEVLSSDLYTTKIDRALDIVASLPVELLVMLPAVPVKSIFFLRLVHLFRLSKLFRRTKKMEEYMLRLGITLHFTTLAVVRGILAYFLVNHWMSCLCFFIHRYFERGVRNTWVIVDGYATFNEVTQTHDICNRDILYCYQRSIYFVGTVLTSVGYGDVAPITTGEMTFQIFLAIVGACMGANICGQLSSYLKLSDRIGEMAFKEKLKSVEHYCSYRNLNPDLRLSLIANYHIMWNKERRVGTKESSFMHALSAGMMGEVALALNKQIIDEVPLFQACRTSLHSRLAYALKPQITLPDTSIYTVGDRGSSFFLILSGQVKVTATKKDNSLDAFTLAGLSLLEEKHAFLRNIHESGHHFGEFSLASKLGVRRDRAIATQLTETYALNKYDMWSGVFLHMPTPEQYLFLKSLFSTVGGYVFLKAGHEMATSTRHISHRYFKSLEQLVTVVIEDITRTGAGASADRITPRYTKPPGGGYFGNTNTGECEEDDDEEIIRQGESTLSEETFNIRRESVY